MPMRDRWKSVLGENGGLESPPGGGGWGFQTRVLDSESGGA